MLLVAVSCFITEIKTIIIFFDKEEKREKRRKKGYAFPKAMKRRLSRFFGKKYYPKRSGGVEIFFQKPAGLDLY